VKRVSARPDRICVIRQGFYPLDPRVRREVAALRGSGRDVDVICLRQVGEPLREYIDGLRILRVPLPHRRQGPAQYVMQYLAFLVAATVLCGALHLRRRYALVQVHSLPDVLVFAAAGPKLLGVPVVLDLHEVMVEFFATKFPQRATPRVLRLLRAAEQASIRFADVAFTCTYEMRDVFVRRGADPGRLGVVHNASEEHLFSPDRHPPRPSPDGAFTLVCHGSVEERYGIETAIRAVGLLRDGLPGVRLRIYGTGSFLEAARQLTRELGLERHVWFSGGWVPLEELVQGIADADAGVVAMKRDLFRDLTQCNKMYDFIAMQKPVVMSRTRSVEAYFGEECFAYFISNDPEDMARAIRVVAEDSDRRGRLVACATERAEPYRWKHQRAVYLRYVDQALARGRS
jgi:glycosyltransferase involved in cell wall biosynthesis